MYISCGPFSTRSLLDHLTININCIVIMDSVRSTDGEADDGFSTCRDSCMRGSGVCARAADAKAWRPAAVLLKAASQPARHGFLTSFQLFVSIDAMLRW